MWRVRGGAGGRQEAASWARPGQPTGRVSEPVPSCVLGAPGTGSDLCLNKSIWAAKSLRAGEGGRGRAKDPGEGVWVWTELEGGERSLSQGGIQGTRSRPEGTGRINTLPSLKHPERFISLLGGGAIRMEGQIFVEPCKRSLRLIVPAAAEGPRENPSAHTTRRRSLA